MRQRKRYQKGSLTKQKRDGVLVWYAQWRGRATEGHLGEVFRRLAAQKECRIEEGHLLSDHVHMMISIPPKYSVSQVIGCIKGKSAIHLARV